MSWSFSKSAPRDEAREVFEEAAKEQHAYMTDDQHAAVLDSIAEFAGDVSDGAPEGAVLTLTSSGHIGTDGLGSASAQVSIAKA